MPADNGPTRRTTEVLHLVVDGANVVGSRPDGWWRDRAGAAQRLARKIRAALASDAEGLARAAGVTATEPRVHLVLEGEARLASDLPAHPLLTVVLAEADGDATIAQLAAQLPSPVVVVTADRALQRRVVDTGAGVVAPGAFLRALDELTTGG